MVPPGGAKAEPYYSLEQSDYVTIVAQTASGLMPLVRQYRPAVEAWTIEVPAGLIDKGEAPAFACARELEEEAGLKALSVDSLGSFHPDTGRLGNRMHVFFARTSDPKPGFVPEPGMEVLFVTSAQLLDKIRSGEFTHQLHIGAIFQSWLSGKLAFS